MMEEGFRLRSDSEAPNFEPPPPPFAPLPPPPPPIEAQSSLSEPDLGGATLALASPSPPSRQAAMPGNEPVVAHAAVTMTGTQKSSGGVSRQSLAGSLPCHSFPGPPSPQQAACSRRAASPVAAWDAAVGAASSTAQVKIETVAVDRSHSMAAVRTRSASPESRGNTAGASTRKSPTRAMGPPRAPASMRSGALPPRPPDMIKFSPPSPAAARRDPACGAAEAAPFDRYAGLGRLALVKLCREKGVEYDLWTPISVLHSLWVVRVQARC